MSLHPTPELLESTYERLRLTPPFKRWKLPDADDLEFCVTMHTDRFGHFRDKDPSEGKKWPDISVSAKHVNSLDLLDRTLAHEMCHIRLLQLGHSRDNHGPRFKKLAATVCRIHGYDLETF